MSSRDTDDIVGVEVASIRKPAARSQHCVLEVALDGEAGDEHELETL
jgi:hypothetical protein